MYLYFFLFHIVSRCKRANGMRHRSRRGYLCLGGDLAHPSTSLSWTDSPGKSAQACETAWNDRKIPSVRCISSQSIETLCWLAFCGRQYYFQNIHHVFFTEFSFSLFSATHSTIPFRFIFLIK